MSKRLRVALLALVASAALPAQAIAETCWHAPSRESCECSIFNVCENNLSCYPDEGEGESGVCR